MSPTFRTWVAVGVAVVFLAPVGWRVGRLIAPESPSGGAWGLAVTLVALFLIGNFWGRGRAGEPD